MRQGYPRYPLHQPGVNFSQSVDSSAFSSREGGSVYQYDPPLQPHSGYGPLPPTNGSVSQSQHSVSNFKSFAAYPTASTSSSYEPIYPANFSPQPHSNYNSRYGVASPLQSHFYPDPDYGSRHFSTNSSRFYDSVPNSALYTKPGFEQPVASVDYAAIPSNPPNYLPQPEFDPVPPQAYSVSSYHYPPRDPVSLNTNKVNESSEYTFVNSDYYYPSPPLSIKRAPMSGDFSNEALDHLKLPPSSDASFTDPHGSGSHRFGHQISWNSAVYSSFTPNRNLPLQPSNDGSRHFSVDSSQCYDSVPNTAVYTRSGLRSSFGLSFAEPIEHAKMSPSKPSHHLAQAKPGSVPPQAASLPSHCYRSEDSILSNTSKLHKSFGRGPVNSHSGYSPPPPSPAVSSSMSVDSSRDASTCVKSLPNRCLSSADTGGRRESVSGHKAFANPIPFPGSVSNPKPTSTHSVPNNPARFNSGAVTHSVSMNQEAKHNSPQSLSMPHTPVQVGYGSSKTAEFQAKKPFSKKHCPSLADTGRVEEGPKLYRDTLAEQLRTMIVNLVKSIREKDKQLYGELFPEESLMAVYYSLIKTVLVERVVDDVVDTADKELVGDVVRAFISELKKTLDIQSRKATDTEKQSYIATLQASVSQWSRHDKTVIKPAMQNQKCLEYLLCAYQIIDLCRSILLDPCSAQQREDFTKFGILSEQWLACKDLNLEMYAVTANLHKQLSNKVQEKRTAISENEKTSESNTKLLWELGVPQPKDFIVGKPERGERRLTGEGDKKGPGKFEMLENALKTLKSDLEAQSWHSEKVEASLPQRESITRKSESTRQLKEKQLRLAELESKMQVKRGELEELGKKLKQKSTGAPEPESIEQLKIELELRVEFKKIATELSNLLEEEVRLNSNNPEASFSKEDLQKMLGTNKDINVRGNARRIKQIKDELSKMSKDAKRNETEFKLSNAISGVVRESETRYQSHYELPSSSSTSTSSSSQNSSTSSFAQPS